MPQRRSGFRYRLAGALAAAALGTMVAAADAPTPRDPADASVFAGQWGERRPFHQAVFSIATGSQVQAAKSGSPTGKAIDHPFLQDVLNNIASPVFRLPGGDRLNDFDYFKDEVTLVDWKRMCDFGGSIPLWGVNATTAPAAHTERMAKALIELGANTDYFELGNELYLDRWKSQTANAREFFAKAAPHAAILRKQFPQAKLGVPGASFWGVVQDPQPGTEFRVRSVANLHPWLKDVFANQGFYDAIVLHLYLTPKEFGLGGLKDRTPDELARWAWVRSDGELLKRIFGTVHEVAPTKEIWVTEWAFNATQYIGKATDPRWPVHQTMLAMLYDARFMLNTAYHVPYVTIMTAWTLYSSPAVCVVTSRGETTVKYDVYRLLRWARQGSDRLSRLEIADNPRWNGPATGQGYEKYSSEVTDVFGFFRGEVLASAVILNIQEHPVAVDLPGLPASATHAIALTQTALLPDWGNRNNPPVNEWNPPRKLRPLSVNGTRVTVPAHSISVVHTQRDLD